MNTETLFTVKEVTNGKVTYLHKNVVPLAIMVLLSFMYKTTPTKYLRIRKQDGTI